MLITPDFRLQLISPGNFHLAVSVAPNGDTCLRSLPGNDASVFISETMGSDSYQLSPGKNVLFRAGKISGATEAPEVCGCPVVKPEMMRTALPETVPAELSAEAPAKPETAVGSGIGRAIRRTWKWTSNFVYRGDEAVQDITGSVARLSLSTDNSKLTLALLPR